jgi:NAD(P)-dependent dehydrogenase (short-subunit alcohol dehydrogenase family)
MSFALSRMLAPARSKLPSIAISYSLSTRLHSTGPGPYSPIQTKLASVKGSKNGNRFKEFDLEDRVYAITGGARGLGLAMAEALLEAGAKVYCLDRLESPDPEFMAAKEHGEREFGGLLEYRRLDVRNDAEVNNVFSEIAGNNQRLDGLIAAAGINYLQSALEHSQTALNEVMQINYNGVFNSATAAARQMFNYQQKGSILLIASMSGLIANKGMTSPVYNSSKAAVIQLARSLAMEWGRHGIRVNSLCPGHIVTPMVEQVFQQNPAARAVWEAENMLGRLAAS